LYFWRKRDNWEAEKEALEKEKNYLVNKYKQLEEIGDDIDKLNKHNITELAKVAAIGIAKLNKLVTSDNPLPFIDQIQKAATALEKIQSAIIKHDTKGVVEHKHSGAVVKIDMDQIMELIIKSREKGIELDTKQAMEVIEAEYKKVT
jgi:hypothetical protein